MTPSDTSDNNDASYLAAAALANAVDVFEANHDIEAAKHALLDGRRAAKLQLENPDELDDHLIECLFELHLDTLHE